ncbi:MAG: Gfo/Idh/MocA family oxidoreductase [Candidatus Glassbacteria bacterium]|nr:Gfo/Idh/MocA family oxidoreductase [Candidatus Glassbacteria bacterium]
MKPIGRREFFRNSAGAAAALSLLAPGKSVPASDRVRIGIMGVGGRGTQLAGWFAAMPDVEVAYLCDVNQRRFERSLEAVSAHQDYEPELVTDFRRILDDPEVDALVNATPDHWHALGAIMACRAGKDVYVEKPLSLNIWEGAQMVRAARKYERVVQVGLQCRSSAYAAAAAEFIKSGGIGDVHLAEVVFQMQHPAVPKGDEQPVPPGLDWDMWCGPGPLVPYSPGRWWFERWDYSTGGIAGDAVHQLDLARMLLDIGYPEAAYADGGVRHFDDGREIPDTQIATFEYGGLTLLFKATLWTPYMKKIPHSIRDSDTIPAWENCSTKIVVQGTAGMMNFGRHGGGWQVYDENYELVRTEPGRQGDAAHLRNFIDCVRSRELPAADVEQGHISTLLCHLSNVSCRVGNRKLVFDPRNQSFPGDPEANAYLGRTYREPWVVPAEV